MWELLLTGQHTPAKILRIATDEWGLRLKNGKSLSPSKIYNLFANIFYIGKYYYYGGKLYENGIHEPMISIDEYDLTQKILGMKGSPRTGNHEFVFTGWIKCECTSSITADERFIKRCPKWNCRYKFNAMS